jgi:hypothetical protein
MKKSNEGGERKTFADHSQSSWFMEDETKIRIGESLNQIMKGKYETLEIKDIIYGTPARTWRIIITPDDKMHLLKTSKELK